MDNKYENLLKIHNLLVTYSDLVKFKTVMENPEASLFMKAKTDEPEETAMMWVVKDAELAESVHQYLDRRLTDLDDKINEVIKEIYDKSKDSIVKNGFTLASTTIL